MPYLHLVDRNLCPLQRLIQLLVWSLDRQPAIEEMRVIIRCLLIKLFCLRVQLREPRRQARLSSRFAGLYPLPSSTENTSRHRVLDRNRESVAADTSLASPEKAQGFQGGFQAWRSPRQDREILMQDVVAATFSSGGVANPFGAGRSVVRSRPHAPHLGRETESECHRPY